MCVPERGGNKGNTALILYQACQPCVIKSNHKETLDKQIEGHCTKLLA